VAIPSVSRGASFRLPWHLRFRKPPLSSRSVGFPKNRSATMTIPADLPVRAQAKVVTDIHPSLRRFVSLLGTYIQNICPAQSLQSLRRRLIPCPAGFHRCACSLLPGRHWPHVRFEPFGTQHIPCNATSTGGDISRLQIFANVQAPTLASPPDCTHRRKPSPARQPGRLHHAPPGWLPAPGRGIASHPTSN